MSQPKASPWTSSQLGILAYLAWKNKQDYSLIEQEWAEKAPATKRSRRAISDKLLSMPKDIEIVGLTEFFEGRTPARRKPAKPSRSTDADVVSLLDDADGHGPVRLKLEPHGISILTEKSKGSKPQVVKTASSVPQSRSSKPAAVTTDVDDKVVDYDSTDDLHHDAVQGSKANVAVLGVPPNMTKKVHLETHRARKLTIKKEHDVEQGPGQTLRDNSKRKKFKFRLDNDDDIENSDIGSRQLKRAKV